MDFSSKSVVFFKPQKTSVNILVASNYSPLMAYFSIENISFLKNYFKLVIANSELVSFIRKVEKYTLYNLSNIEVLEEFLIYAKNEKKDVIVSIPIFNFEKDLKNKLPTCFGNFITSQGSDDTHIALNIANIIIDGKEVSSPCDICRLKAEQVSGICLYKTTAYDCLFNCDIPKNEEQEIKVDKEYTTEDLKTLGEFWESTEGEIYK